MGRTGPDDAQVTLAAPGTSERDARVAQVPARCGLTCLALGVMVLAGWAASSRWLVAGQPDLTPMQPWTATAFVALGLALILQDRRRPVALACAVTVATLAVVMLGEHALDAGHRFDLLLSSETVQRLQPENASPGRMAPSTAAGFGLLALAVAGARRHPRWASAFGMVGVALSYAAVVAYAYGEEDLFRAGDLTAIALPTALGLAVVGVAVATLTPTVGLTRFVLTGGSTGLLMRRLLPVAVLAPLAAGALLTAGRNAGWWSGSFRVSMLTVTSAAAVAGVGAWASGRAAQAEADREVAHRTAQDAARIAREHSTRTEALLAVAPVGIFEADASGAIVWVNAQVSTFAGRPREELLGTGWAHAVHPEDAADVTALWEKAIGQETTFHARLRLVAANGRVTVVQAAADVLRDTEGRMTGMLGAITDITAASRAEARFRASFEYAPVGMVLVSSDDRVAEVNEAMAELLVSTRDALVGQPLATLVHPDDVDLLAERLVLPPDAPATAPRRDLRWSTPGEPVWSSVHAVRLDQAEGFPARYLLHVVDVTERHAHEQRLAHLADHDPLTGLLNRRAFEQRLGESLERIARYGGWGALLLFDLDRFKPVNDTLGHSAGDQLLVTVAEQLERHLRTSDLLGRLGGDEFAVYLPRADKALAVLVAEKVLGEIRTSVFVPDAQSVPHRVTASMGIALSEQDVLDAGALLRRADVAMYAAKDGGRDRFVVATGPGSAVEPRAHWGRRIETALAEDRLVLHAQPIIDLRTGATARYEVLVRLREDDGTLVPPAAFLRDAERLGSIEAIDRWVAEQSIDLAAAMTSRDAVLEINLSARSLGAPSLVEAIAEHLGKSGVDPARLVFEVSETDAIAHLGEVRDVADHLHALGCGFALDNFGTGFGSFAYLKHLPVDYLKIDGEFVGDCAESRTDELVVEAVVAVARGLGKETVAERVADAPTLALVRELGVDYAQGFEVGRPLPVAQLLGSSA